jgi:micrococcal nuclease
MKPKKIIFLLILILTLSVPSFALAWTGKCVGVTDGDTITVMHNGVGEKIRLYGIDTPEKRQDFGSKAKWFLSDLVFKKVVEVQPQDTDRYGRTVGIVFVSGLNVNREIVKAGYAWVYQRYCTRAFCNEWQDLESTARRNGIGLWSHPDPIPPWQFRRDQRVSSATSPATNQQAGAYHGNRKSHVFHGSSCRYYNCKNCTVIFNSREDAITAGYRPCGSCRP